jgi:hypothetical protein
MALAPPYDKIPALIPLAISQIQTLINKIISFLTKKVMELVTKANQIGKNVKCDDPRIQNLKDLLEKIKRTIDKLLEVLTILTIIIPVATVVANIASTILSIQLVLPLPAVPAVSQTITIQNETIASVLGGLKQASIIVTITTGSLALISSLLGPVINLLSSVCQNETFQVDSKTQESIINNVKTELDKLNLNGSSGADGDSDDIFIDRNEDVSQIDTSLYQDFVNSEFYRPINLSESDLENRDETIDDLLERQKNLLENIIEAPSKSIVNDDISRSGAPAGDLGTRGDYYIDKTTRTLYGPKISDTEWGTSLKY